MIVFSISNVIFIFILRFLSYECPLGYFAEKLVTKKDLPDDEYPDFIGDSVMLPGPDKGSWCQDASCSVDATFNPRYPCSCSNGWLEILSKVHRCRSR